MMYTAFFEILALRGFSESKMTFTVFQGHQQCHR